MCFAEDLNLDIIELASPEGCKLFLDEESSYVAPCALLATTTAKLKHSTLVHVRMYTVTASINNRRD